MEFYCIENALHSSNSVQSLPILSKLSKFKTKILPFQGILLTLREKNKYKNEKLARGVLRLFTYQRAAGVSAVQFHQEPLFPLY